MAPTGAPGFVASAQASSASKAGACMARRGRAGGPSLEVTTGGGGGAGADDEFVAGIIAVAFEHGTLKCRQDVALEGAGFDERRCFSERLVREHRRLSNIDDLGRALDRALARHRERGI